MTGLTKDTEKSASVDNDDGIRSAIVNFMASQGFKKMPVSEDYPDETNDFFVKGGSSKMIQVAISSNADKEVIDSIMDMITADEQDITMCELGAKQS